MSNAAAQQSQQQAEASTAPSAARGVAEPPAQPQQPLPPPPAASGRHSLSAYLRESDESLSAAPRVPLSRDSAIAEEPDDAGSADDARASAAAMRLPARASDLLSDSDAKPEPAPRLRAPLRQALAAPRAPAGAHSTTRVRDSEDEKRSAAAGPPRPTLRGARGGAVFGDSDDSSSVDLSRLDAAVDGVTLQTVGARLPRGPAKASARRERGAFAEGHFSAPRGVPVRTQRVSKGRRAKGAGAEEEEDDEEDEEEEDEENQDEDASGPRGARKRKSKAAPPAGYGEDEEAVDAQSALRDAANSVPLASPEVAAFVASVSPQVEQSLSALYERRAAEARVAAQKLELMAHKYETVRAYLSGVSAHVAKSAEAVLAQGRIKVNALHAELETHFERFRQRLLRSQHQISFAVDSQSAAMARRLERVHQVRRALRRRLRRSTKAEFLRTFPESLAAVEELTGAPLSFSLDEAPRAAADAAAFKGAGGDAGDLVRAAAAVSADADVGILTALESYSAGAGLPDINDAALAAMGLHCDELDMVRIVVSPSEAPQPAERQPPRRERKRREFAPTRGAAREAEADEPVGAREAGLRLDRATRDVVDTLARELEHRRKLRTEELVAGARLDALRQRRAPHVEPPTRESAPTAASRAAPKRRSKREPVASSEPADAEARRASAAATEAAPAPSPPPPPPPPPPPHHPPAPPTDPDKRRVSDSESDTALRELVRSQREVAELMAWAKRSPHARAPRAAAV